MPREGFATIAADPPWRMKAGPLTGREGFLDAKGPSRDLAYPSMSVDEIAALGVGDLADRNAHLYLWVPNAYMDRAHAVVKAWGFRYSTTLVWSKRPMGGGLGGAFGISTEFIIFARRGRLPHKLKVVGTCFNWKRPYDSRGKPRHSAKPPAFFDMVETVSPGAYLELFARERRLGWSAWGNEVDSDVELVA